MVRVNTLLNLNMNQLIVCIFNQDIDMAIGQLFIEQMYYSA